MTDAEYAVQIRKAISDLQDAVDAATREGLAVTLLAITPDDHSLSGRVRVQGLEAEVTRTF